MMSVVFVHEKHFEKVDRSQYFKISNSNMLPLSSDVAQKCIVVSRQDELNRQRRQKYSNAQVSHLMKAPSVTRWVENLSPAEMAEIMTK